MNRLWNEVLDPLYFGKARPCEAKDFIITHKVVINEDIDGISTILHFPLDVTQYIDDTVHRPNHSVLMHPIGKIVMQDRSAEELKQLLGSTKTQHIEIIFKDKS